jgi:dienelactone hydrolase
VPDSGRPFFQGAFSMIDRASPARLDFANPDRAPLLIIAGEEDRAMPPAIVRRMFHAHRASPARTDFRSYPGRTHWLIAQDGWEEVAHGCSEWIEALGDTDTGTDRGFEQAGLPADGKDPSVSSAPRALQPVLD